MLERTNLEDCITTRDGLSGNVVSAIAEDDGGNLWVGTEDGGLNCFKDGKFASYQASEDGLPGNDISCLYLDNDGVLWVGTSGHGLARFHKGKWTRYSKRGRPRQRQHQLHHRETTQVIYGLAPIWD